MTTVIWGLTGIEWSKISLLNCLVADSDCSWLGRELRSAPCSLSSLVSWPWFFHIVVTEKHFKMMEQRSSCLSQVISSPPCCIRQVISRAQLRMEGMGNRLHLFMGGMIKSHYKGACIQIWEESLWSSFKDSRKKL